MKRLAGILGLIGAVGAASLLFYVKHEVGVLKEELSAVHRKIRDHQDAMQVLKTEWSFLNQPARLADLAKRHLGLRPIATHRVVTIEDLPLRAAAPGRWRAWAPAVPQGDAVSKIGDTR